MLRTQTTKPISSKNPNWTQAQNFVFFPISSFFSGRHIKDFDFDDMWYSSYWSLPEAKDGLFLLNFARYSSLIMPPPLIGVALSDDAVWLLVCLMPVAYIGPKSRTERPRKTRIDTEVVHITCQYCMVGISKYVCILYPPHIGHMVAHIHIVNFASKMQFMCGACSIMVVHDSYPKAEELQCG